MHTIVDCLGSIRLEPSTPEPRPGQRKPQDMIWGLPGVPVEWNTGDLLSPLHFRLAVPRETVPPALDPYGYQSCAPGNDLVVDNPAVDQRIVWFIYWFSAYPPFIWWSAKIIFRTFHISPSWTFVWWNPDLTKNWLESSQRNNLFNRLNPVKILSMTELSLPRSSQMRFICCAQSLSWSIGPN